MEDDIDVDKLTTCEEVANALHVLEIAEWYPNQQLESLQKKKQELLRRKKELGC